VISSSRSDGSVFNVATTDASGKDPPAVSLATPSSSVSTTSRKRGLSDDIEMGSTIDAQHTAQECRFGKARSAST
jgi:hypothetical protein